MKKKLFVLGCMLALSMTTIVGCGKKQQPIDQVVSGNAVSINYITEESLKDPEPEIVPEPIDYSLIDIPYEEWEKNTPEYSAPDVPMEEISTTGMTACEVLDLYMYDKDNVEYINLDYKTVPNMDELVHKLRSFTNLTQVDMCDCGLSNQQMDALNKAFPDIKIVWRIRVNRWAIRTDAKSFSTYQGNVITYRWTNNDAELFRYCPEMVAIDLGHNSVSSLSWLKYVPELRILILADNWGIKDISDIVLCQKLQYVELFMESFSDLSPLAELPYLRDLNICYTKVEDITPLLELEYLERLWTVGCWYIPRDDYQLLRDAFPDLVLNIYNGGSTDGGWRNHPRYYAMRDTYANNYLNPLFEEIPTVVTNCTSPNYVPPVEEEPEETEESDDSEG